MVTEKVEEVVIVKKIIAPWPEGKKEFHTALYFMRMAQDPNLRTKYQPDNLFNICKCVLDDIEKDYEYEPFMTKFNNNLTPENQRYIYEKTYKCSVKEIQQMKTKQPEFNLKQMAHEEIS